MYFPSITFVALLSATVSAAPNTRPQHEPRDYWVNVQMFGDHSCHHYVAPDPRPPAHAHGDCTTRGKATHSIKAKGHNCRISTWSLVNCDGSHANIPVDGKCHDIPYASYRVDCD